MEAAAAGAHRESTGRVDPWHALTDAVKEATGARGRSLFLPLRRALTGRDHGPDMGELLPLIAEGSGGGAAGGPLAEGRCDTDKRLAYRSA